MKTIKQIADELGVSKQAVQKRISREPLYTRLYPYIHTNNNIKYIAEDGQALIVSAFQKNAPTTSSIDVADNQKDNVYSDVSSVLATLQEQLKVKDAQLAALTVALENTTASLHAAHALHAGTMQQQLTDGRDANQEESPTEPNNPCVLSYEELHDRFQQQAEKLRELYGRSWWQRLRNKL